MAASFGDDGFSLQKLSIVDTVKLLSEEASDDYVAIKNKIHLYGEVAKTMLTCGKYEKAANYCQSGLAACKLIPNNSVIIGQFMYVLAQAHYRQSKVLLLQYKKEEGTKTLNLSLEFYHGCLELSHSSEGLDLHIRALDGLGNVCHLLGHFKKAIFYHTKYLQCVEASGDLVNQQRTLTNIAHAYLMLNSVGPANYYHWSLELAIALKDPYTQAQCYYSLAALHLVIKNYQISLQYYKKHLQMALLLRDRFGQCKSYWGLGRVYIGLKKFHYALLCANKHFLIAEEIDDSMESGIAKRNITDLIQMISFTDNNTGPNQRRPSGASTKIRRSHSSRLSSHKDKIITRY